MNSLFTQHQWIGIAVMTAIIALFIGGFYLADYITRHTEETAIRLDSITTEQIVSLQEHNKPTYLNTQKSKDTIPLFLHPFDPNTADSIELLQLGLRPWMVKNMLRYRAKGGKWRTKEAVRKVYGMTDELYQQIQPYVVIDSVSYATENDSTKEQLPLQYTVKKDTVLELNSADTAQLKLLRGIGSGYARRIVSYRKALGGYISTDQLHDIKEIPASTIDSIIPHFIVDSTLVVAIPVNHSTAERLRNHPYLNFTQARAIYELRRKKFRLKNIDELEDLECLSPEEVLRLKPYLSFAE